MALSWKGDAALTVGQTASFAPAMPTHAAGDMLLALWTGKPFDATVTVSTSGWTLLIEGASGTTAAGVDLGSMKGAVWYKEATSSAETAPTFTEGATAWNVAGGGVVAWQKDGGQVWVTPVAAGGADEDLGANVSITTTSDPGVTSGDGIQINFGVCSDASAPLTAGPTITQTGVTFGAVTKDRDQESTAGGDHAMITGHCVVSSGTGSAAPVIGGTVADSGSPRWIGSVIRLRQETPPAATGTGWWGSRNQW